MAVEFKPKANGVGVGWYLKTLMLNPVRLKAMFRPLKRRVKTETSKLCPF
jgi:hypothetical protein